MGTELSLSVLRTDDAGEPILEIVPKPKFGVADSYIWELFDQNESARWFSSVSVGCDLDWYRRPTMELCLTQQRSPTAADCYSPAVIRRDVLSVLDRLERPQGYLPRRYSVQKSNRLGQWETGCNVFFGGRQLAVGAGWDHCRAVWYRERPFMEQIQVLLAGDADIAHDLRQRRTFPCMDAAWDGQAWIAAEPIVLTIRSVSAAEHFRRFLEPILAFCDEAIAAGYVVFTNRH